MIWLVVVSNTLGWRCTSYWNWGFFIAMLCSSVGYLFEPCDFWDDFPAKPKICCVFRWLYIYCRKNNTSTRPGFCCFLAKKSSTPTIGYFPMRWAVARIHHGCLKLWNSKGPNPSNATRNAANIEGLWSPPLSRYFWPLYAFIIMALFPGGGIGEVGPLRSPSSLPKVWCELRDFEWR